MKILDLNCSFKAINKRIFSEKSIPTKYKDMYPLLPYIEI
jgi:hypothetical protein